MKKIILILTTFCLFLTSCNLINPNTNVEKDYTELFPSIPSMPTLEVPVNDENNTNETTINNDVVINTETIISTENNVVDSIEKSIINVVDFAEKSTIMIKTSNKKINEFEYQGFGSGVIYNKNENNIYSVLTNKHVVENSKYFKIKTIYEEVDAFVYGIANNYDVAIMYFQSNLDYNITKIEPSENIKKGQYAIAVGTPLDEEYFNSVSVGNISLISDNYIKHTASLNSGNSGGPLYNLNGNLIGLNYQKLSGETNSGASIEGQFFAICLNDINEAIKDICAIKLGISVVDIETVLEYKEMISKYPDYSKYIEEETHNFYMQVLDKMPQESQKGVVIYSVDENGISYNKLQKLDFIYKINDINISKSTDIRKIPCSPDGWRRSGILLSVSS